MNGMNHPQLFIINPPLFSASSVQVPEGWADTSDQLFPGFLNLYWAHCVPVALLGAKDCWMPNPSHTLAVISFSGTFKGPFIVLIFVP